MDKYKNIDKIEQIKTNGDLIEEVFVDELTKRTNDFLVVGLQGFGDQDWSRQLELVGWEDQIDLKYRLFGGKLLLSQEHTDRYIYRTTDSNVSLTKDRITLSYTYATEMGGLAIKRLFNLLIDPNEPIDDSKVTTKLLNAHLLRRKQQKASAISS